MAAPAQSRAIEGELQYFTFRLTRAHDILDDVRAGERTPQFRRQSELCYGEHLVEPLQDRGGNAPQSFSRCRARLRRSVSDLPASSSSHACRNTRLTCACIDFGKRSMMLRALCR